MTERSPGRAGWAQNNRVAFAEDFKFVDAVKIQIAWKTDRTVIAIFKYRYGSMVVSLLLWA